MHDRSPRSSHLVGSGGRAHWAAWLPLVFAGSMMFWTVAVVLGGWSLMVVSDGEMNAPVQAPTATAMEPRPGVEAQGAGGMFDRISVQVEESQESEDVNDNAGSVTGVDTGVDTIEGVDSVGTVGSVGRSFPGLPASAVRAKD
jgi:hypothetical protein